MSSEVSDLLVALRAGTIGLDDVARRFRQRAWPHSSAEPPVNYIEFVTAAQQDPGLDVPGSFDEVTAAYDRGELTRVQYRTLAQAAAESTWAEDSGE